MNREIKYLTFDLFHEVHKNILRRAKELGDYLVVGVTSENYDKQRGKLNVQQSVVERIENVKNSGYADQVIVEEYFGQKIEDIKKYNIDTFVIGSDWKGKFDYLKEYCEVVYLPRTEGVSSTQLRNQDRGILKLGCVGTGRIAHRMLAESKFVSGLSLDYIYDRNIDKAHIFADENDLTFYTDNYDELLQMVDAVYVAIPHPFHYEYTRKALEAGKHVICEKPFTLNYAQSRELYDMAHEKGLVLYEAIKTAYVPAFKRLQAIAKSGVIGQIKDVDATFTKLIDDRGLREFNPAQGGGSLNELATYPLIAIFKLLGCDYKNVMYYSYTGDSEVDLYTKIVLEYKDAVATANIGIGVKKEGSLVVSGTKGYIYVPAPWWKTDYFEVRFENPADNQKHYFQFEGDGLRYELSEFLNSIVNKTSNISLSEDESCTISKVLEQYKEQEKVKKI